MLDLWWHLCVQVSCVQVCACTQLDWFVNMFLLNAYQMKLSHFQYMRHPHPVAENNNTHRQDMTLINPIREFLPIVSCHTIKDPAKIVLLFIKHGHHCQATVVIASTLKHLNIYLLKINNIKISWNIMTFFKIKSLYSANWNDLGMTFWNEKYFFNINNIESTAFRTVQYT